MHRLHINAYGHSEVLYVKYVLLKTILTFQIHSRMHLYNPDDVHRTELLGQPNVQNRIIGNVFMSDVEGVH